VIAAKVFEKRIRTAFAP
jgi:phosphoadenosine phosphosulfate reductase